MSSDETYMNDSIYTKNASNRTNGYWDMTLDVQTDHAKYPSKIVGG